MRADISPNNKPQQLAYIAAVLLAFGAAWWLALPLLVPEHPLLTAMAIGASLFLGGWALAPSTLDLTMWTLTVMVMTYWGAIMFVASPIIYALWVAFISPHMEVSFK